MERLSHPDLLSQKPFAPSLPLRYAADVLRARRALIALYTDGPAAPVLAALSIDMLIEIAPTVQI